MSFSTVTAAFTATCCQPYPFVLLALVIASAVSGRINQTCTLLLVAMNLLLAVAATVQLIQLAAGIIHLFNVKNEGISWRITGPYWWAYWMLYMCTIFPIIFWRKALRTNKRLSGIAALLILISYFGEKIVILLTSQYRDARPAAWALYSPGFSAYVLLFGLYAIMICSVLVLTKLSTRIGLN